MIRYIIRSIYNILPKKIVKEVVVKEIIKEQVLRVPLLPEHIDHLENTFPAPVWKVGTSTTESHVYATGQNEVVQYLKRWSERSGRSYAKGTTKR